MKIALAFTMADGQIFGSNASEQKTYQPVKKLFSPTPPAFGAPFGVIPSEFRRDFFCVVQLESLGYRATLSLRSYV